MGAADFAPSLTLPRAMRRGGDSKNRLSKRHSSLAPFLLQLDRAAIDDIRLALNQSQPLGNARFYAKIERMTALRREARPRGRPRLESKREETALPGQTGLDFSDK